MFINANLFNFLKKFKLRNYLEVMWTTDCKLNVPYLNNKSFHVSIECLLSFMSIRILFPKDD